MLKAKRKPCPLVETYETLSTTKKVNKITGNLRMDIFGPWIKHKFWVCKVFMLRGNLSDLG